MIDLNNIRPSFTRFVSAQSSQLQSWATTRISWPRPAGPTCLKDRHPIVPDIYGKDLLYGIRSAGELGRGEGCSFVDIHLWMFMYGQLSEAVIINNEVCSPITRLRK